MIEYFEIQDINNSAAAFNTEKLLWLNQHYIKNSDPKRVAEELAWHMKRLDVDVTQGPPLTEIVKAQAERVKTLREMAEKSQYFYCENIVYNPESVNKHITPDVKPAMAEIRAGLASLRDWNKEAIHQVIVDISLKLEIKMGKVAQPIRVAVTGDTISPPID